MRKLMLEALAACLASAAVCGQARAAMQTGANAAASPFLSGEVATSYSDGKVPEIGSFHANADVALLSSAATDRSGTRLTTRVNAASNPFRVDALQSVTAFGDSLPGADDFSLGSRHGTGSKRRAILNQRDAFGAPQGEIPSVNDGGQLKVIQTVRDEGSEAMRSKLIAHDEPAPGTTVAVPEPGSWSTLLAGLLGVIAIARRRMSL
jgi:hypothetical protein